MDGLGLDFGWVSAWWNTMLGFGWPWLVVMAISLIALLNQNLGNGSLAKWTEFGWLAVVFCVGFGMLFLGESGLAKWANFGSHWLWVVFVMALDRIWKQVRAMIPAASKAPAKA